MRSPDASGNGGGETGHARPIIVVSDAAPRTTCKASRARSSARAAASTVAAAEARSAVPADALSAAALRRAISERTVFTASACAEQGTKNQDVRCERPQPGGLCIGFSRRSAGELETSR